jgi:PKD repeat protein
MPAGGVIASTSTSRNHMYPSPAFLGLTQEIVLFFSEQDLDQIMRGIYAQKFDLEGNRLWGEEGKQLIALSYNDYALFSADGKDNTAICIYQAFEFGNYADAKMQAVMLDDQGDFVWADQFIDLCTYQSQKLHNVMSNYYMGQWVAVWGDLRNGEGDIYAQNIQPDGSLGVVQNQPPVADFTWTPDDPTTQSAVQFTDQSYDPVGYLVNWTWDFGDGTSSFIQNPIHQYDTPGTYTVDLTVRDNDGVSDSASKDVSVSGSQNNISILIKSGLGVTVIFSNNGSSDVLEVPWEIHVQGGLLGRIDKTVNGSIDIPAGESVTKRTGLLFGLGALTISVKIADVEETATGTQLFIFSLVKA